MNSLKDLRAKRGLTQTQLANKIATNRTTYTCWENGISKPRNLKTIVALAKALRCSIGTVTKALMLHEKDKKE